VNFKSVPHVVVFVAVAGAVLYLASAAWGALFIINMPNAPDWCTEFQTRQVGEWETTRECVRFKNRLEQLKYEHDVGMVARNTYWVYGSLVACAVLALIAFRIIPGWRGTLAPKESGGAIGTALVIGLFAWVTPWLFALPLPSPAEWFPAEFREINDLRVRETLERLQRSAQ
jgi:hypothetical protein